MSIERTILSPFTKGFYNSYSTKHSSPTFKNLEYCVTVVNEMNNMWILLQGTRISFVLSFEVECHSLEPRFF